MNLTELKAQAYDIIAAIEDLTKQLNAVNAEIAKHYKGEPEPEPEPDNAE